MAARKRSKRSTARRNPPLVIFGNPDAVGDVKAIVYKHAKNGELYVHAFGPRGEDIELSSNGDSVTINHVPMGPTGAKLLARSNGSLAIISARGERLWQEFPE